MRPGRSLARLLIGALAVAVLLPEMPAAPAKKKRRRDDPGGPPGPQQDPPRKRPGADRRDPRCSDRAERCDDRLLLRIEEEGPPARPVPAFRYRLRIGDESIEGRCPDERAGEGAARCAAEGVGVGVLLGLAPDELDVTIEAPGLRPLLQTLRPEYGPGCCRQGEARLSLRAAAPPPGAPATPPGSTGPPAASPPPASAAR